MDSVKKKKKKKLIVDGDKLDFDLAQKQLKKHPKKQVSIDDAERYVTDIETGLTTRQVGNRLLTGLMNCDVSKHGKSYARIILGNIFTFFNMLYLAIAIVLLSFGQYKNVLFLTIIVANTTVAIVQEIKSKRMLDKLNLVSVPKVTVIRDSKEQSIPITNIVLDDIIVVDTGNQITCDCIVMKGSVEVNESILTGESDAISKKPGDILYAGSFVVAGNCIARADRVGKYNYIAGLSGRVRKYKKPRSQMLRSLRGILLFVAIIVLPMAAGLWQVNWAVYSQYFPAGDRQVIIWTLNKTSGSIISMIPAGPFLLTTMALAVSVLRLAKGGTMVQELYCIEMLARVDCLCLDKTGTITDGTMRVIECVDLRTSGKAGYDIKDIMSSYNRAINNNNMTGKALVDYFGDMPHAKLNPSTIVPFSSARKLSAVTFDGVGTFILGAPEFVLRTENTAVSEMVETYAKKGLRVLLLAQSSTPMQNAESLPVIRRPIALIVIEDHIRPEASDTIKWFMENNVDVKVISGDNPVAVSNIALRVGIKNAENYISLEGMTDKEVVSIADKYTVFGRVSPDQKALLVKALREHGKTVAMTGDGVNDILALKESDCSIALAGGSDAARNVSHLVLMEDNFSTLPQVVAEGRRVVNNIQSASSMYFMKTIYIIFINILLIMLHYIWHISSPTPYESIQIMLLEMVVVGVPTMLLALQPNHSIIKGKFLPNVLKRCIPPSIVFMLSTISLYVLNMTVMKDMSADVLSTLIALTYTYGGLFALYYACRPFNTWKIIMYASIAVIVTIAIVIFYDFWSYSPLNREQALLLTVEILALPYLMRAVWYVTARADKIYRKIFKRKEYLEEVQQETEKDDQSQKQNTDNQ